MPLPILAPTELDPLRPGASAAVRTCLNVQPADRVVVITDLACAAIGQVLADESIAAGAPTRIIVLEDYAARPLLDLPPGLVDDIVAFKPTVSFYAASALPGEIVFRFKLSRAYRSDGEVRHGHMPGVTARLMTEGMLVDYDLIYNLTMRVNDIAKAARRMYITSPKGTDLHVLLNPNYKWIPCHGRYHTAGDWGNLPEGETYTCPESVDGVIAAEILGDYFSEKYGILQRPVFFTIAGGVVTDVQCENTALAAEITAYLDSSENGRRVGEFAVGTNVGLTGFVGNLLQDEKFPGIHVAFGNPYRETGATWSANIHVDVIPTQCTIDVDGRRIMTGGVFAPDILAGL